MIKLGLFLGAIFSVQLQAAPIPAALQDLRGLRNGEALTFDAKTTKTLVVFWATWCADCKEKLTKTLPEWQKASSDLAIIAVGTDKEKDRIAHFVEKEKISLPVFLDEAKKVRKELKIFSVPSWAVYRLDEVTKSWKMTDTAQAFDEDRVKKALR